MLKACGVYSTLGCVVSIRLQGAAYDHVHQGGCSARLLKHQQPTQLPQQQHTAVKFHLPAKNLEKIPEAVIILYAATTEAS